jgi:hypothetical protein
MSKVVTLRKGHKTFRDMATEAVGDERAIRGVVVWFEEDGTMHFGRFGTVLSDIGMMQMYVQMLAVEAMQDG